MDEQQRAMEKEKAVKDAYRKRLMEEVQGLVQGFSKIGLTPTTPLDPTDMVSMQRRFMENSEILEKYNVQFQKIEDVKARFDAIDTPNRPKTATRQEKRKLEEEETGREDTGVKFQAVE